MRPHSLLLNRGVSRDSEYRCGSGYCRDRTRRTLPVARQLRDVKVADAPRTRAAHQSQTTLHLDSKRATTSNTFKYANGTDAIQDTRTLNSPETARRGERRGIAHRPRNGQQHFVGIKRPRRGAVSGRDKSEGTADIRSAGALQKAMVREIVCLNHGNQHQIKMGIERRLADRARKYGNRTEHKAG